MKIIVCSLMMSLAAAAGSCSSDSVSTQSAVLSPGVTFAFPRDGQDDVPTQTRMIFQFTDAVNADVLAAPCTLAGTVVQGGFCVLGPDGLVATATSVLGPDGTIVVATSSELRAGQSYQVFVRPSVLRAGGSNLPDETALLRFRTRQAAATIAAPELLSVGGEDPRAFSVGGPAPRLPVLDRSSLRLLFSEALAESSVVAGQSVTLRRTGSATNLGGTVLAQGPHLLFDPDRDLEPGTRYELTLTGLTDRSGTAIPTTTLVFVPATSVMYEQTVEVDQPGSATGAGSALSPLSGAAINSVLKRSSLTGNEQLGILPGTLRVELGDPKIFGGPIPFTLRKGQRLDASSLATKLAGVVGLGVQTGTLHFDLLSDATGWLTRNSYRPASTRPDDRSAPLLVDLVFDAALTADDPAGNPLVTQTLMNIHLLGTATSTDGQLVLEVAGAIEIELLGITRATADLSLRLRTGAVPLATDGGAPRIVTTLPARGSTDASVDGTLQILFSGAIDLGKLQSAAELSLTSTAGAVPVGVRVDGGALAVIPRQPLQPSTSYTLRLGTLFDISGRPLALSAGDPTAGTGELTFTTAATPGGATVPPQLLSVVPGASCALTGATDDSPGRCVGGEDSDRTYLPFVLPSDRSLEARFTQPLDRATLKLGTACGSGAIRVEGLKSDGTCEVIKGILDVATTGFRFTPAQPWTPGKPYKFTLVSGADGTCGIDEICGRNGRPFNPDALNGAGGGGGPAVVISFTAVAANNETLIPLATAPFGDRNGNGRIDPGELHQVNNEFAIEVASTSGIVTAASLGGQDCRPALPGNQVCADLAADLPVTVLPTLNQCPIDATGAPSTSARPCVPIRISAQSVRTTELTINATARILLQTIQISDVDTGLMHLRLLENDPAGVVGYILNADDGNPVFVIAVSTLMDAPDLEILAGIVSHDVRSKPVNLLLGGPVTFLADGRMQVVLHNRGPVTIPVTISTLGFSGIINLRIPDGTLTLSLLTPPIR